MDEAKAESYLKEGEELYKQDHYDQAIIWFTKSIEQYPSDRAYDFRGCAYLENGEYDKSISDFTEAIKTCPPEDNIGLSKTYYNRAESYRRKGNSDRALADVRAALELDFTNKEAQRLYGYLTKSPFPSPSILLKYYKRYHSTSNNVGRQMKKKRSFINTLSGVLWSGTCFWYMAGLVSIHVSVDYLQTPALWPVYWFLMKAALPWGACGMAWTAFCVVPWSSGSRPPVQNEQQLDIIMRGFLILSIFAVVVVLAAIYNWYLPTLKMPENVILKSGRTCRIVGWFVTFGATLVTNSLVRNYLLKLTIDRTGKGKR